MKITEFRTKGGLKNPELQQLAQFQYIEADTENPTPKLCINIGMEYTKGGWRESPSSLRFDSYTEALRFLKEFIKSIVTYGFKQGSITDFNNSYQLAKIQKEVSECYIHTLHSQ